MLNFIEIQNGVKIYELTSDTVSIPAPYKVKAGEQVVSFKTLAAAEEYADQM